MFRRLLTCSCFAVPLAAGCSGSSGPLPVAGRYLLQSVDGFNPPFLRWATIQCDWTVLGATLTIGPANNADLEVEETVDCTRAGGQLIAGGRSYPGTYVVAGKTFTLLSPTLGGPPITLVGSIHIDGRTLDIADPADYAASPGVLRLRR